MISPLLANVYIHRLLRAWKKFGVEPTYRGLDRYTSQLLCEFLLRRHKVESPRYSGHPTFEVKEVFASHQIGRRPGW